MKKALVLVFVISLVGLADGASRSRGLREPLLVVPSTASPGIKDMARAEGGWVCDGDGDENEINAAIQSAHAGGRVLCAAGTYSIKSPIILRSNVELRFAEGNRVVVAAGHSFEAPGNQVTLFTDTVPVSTVVRNANAGDGGSGDSGIVLRGLHLDAGQGVGDPIIYTNDDVHHMGILLDQCTDSVIEDCVVEGVAYVAPESVDDYGRNCGFCLTRCTSVEIRRCEANENGYEGFGVRGTSTNCKVLSCRGTQNAIHLAQAAAWHGDASYGDGHTGVLFSGLYSSDNGAIFHGNAAQPITRSAIQQCNVYVINLKEAVSKCSAVNNYARQVNIAPLDGTMADILVANNLLEGQFDGSTWPGIWIALSFDGGSASRLNILGNTISEGRIRVSQGAGYDGTLSGSLIAANVVKDTSDEGIGVQIELSGDGDVTDVAIRDNTFEQTWDASNSCAVKLDLNAGSTANIRRITISGNSFNSQYGVLEVNGGSGAIEDISVIDNIIKVYSNPVKGDNGMTRLAFLRNVILNSQSVINGPIDDIIFDGNILVNITGFTANSPTNLAMGVNPSWKGGVGENGAWRLKQDDADVDKLYIQKLISGTWTTAGTFDASP